MKKKILVIDDEKNVRDVMARILGREGYQVLLAEDGEEALSILDEETTDLIMLDMNMPRMNGLEFLRRINEQRKQAAPVLMVTGDTDNRLRAESYRLGVYDFISKPEEIEVLLKRVENGLKIGEVLRFNESIRMELMIARKLQQYLFPDASFENRAVRINARTKPLSDVGGDLYDFVQFRDGRVIFFVADVSGHGIAGAIFTALVKMGFRNALHSSEDPGAILTRMNNDLCNNLPVESFVTMFCGVVDPTEDVMRYANAGHPRPYIVKSGNISYLEGSDPFLGPVRDFSYLTRSISLRDMDSLVVYTDGTQDIYDTSGNHVTEEFFRNLVSKNLPGDKWIQNFMDTVDGREFRVIDDCTVMFLEFGERA